jgi:hypothetical protein
VIKHPTREAWLNAAADLVLARYREVFETHFGDIGVEHLQHLRVSTGFPSRGGLTKVIGECWKSIAAEDELTHHIFINPRLTDLVEVVATLAHEMVHAADDGEHKHKGPFLKAVRDMGLEGKATATVAGAAFADWVRSTAFSEEVGEYPHVGLVPVMEVKKQSTRMLKLEAKCCGYIARTTKKWIEIGLPSCPCGNEFPRPEGLDEEE